MIEASRVAAVTTDGAGTVTSWNDAAARIFGIRAHEMIGCPIENVMPERFRPEHAAGMRRMRCGGASKLSGKTVELLGLHADGHEFPLEMTLSSWIGANGIEFGAFIQDIGERRIREGRLERLALHDPLTGSRTDPACCPRSRSSSRTAAAPRYSSVICAGSRR